MELFIQATTLLIGMFILLKSADYFLDTASSLARRFGISELLISLTLVALGTSLPEVGVSIFGSLGGYPALALSNILGSVIFNTCICIGIVAMLAEIKVLDKQMIFRDCIMLLATYTLLYFVIAVTGIDALWGTIFIFLYIFYLLLLYRDRKNHKIKPEDSTIKHDWLIALLSIVGIAIGAHFAVGSAVSLATLLSIPQWLVGATILAVGTSLPELVVSLMALKKHKLEMSIGNVLGSNIFDILIGLGAASIIAPIAPVFADVFVDLIILIAATIVVVVAALTKYKMHKKGGIALLLIYLLYLVYLITPYIRWW